ncbi:MAG TPA: hypothetical protein VFJ58_02890 [Armatimonadota bacterium]|nr:hypothetical protein [Armatimonadota bacterium]
MTHKTILLQDEFRKYGAAKDLKADAQIPAWTAVKSIQHIMAVKDEKGIKA